MGKAKYVLAFVLIAAVLLGAPGSVANAKANKITGGGWFIDDSSGNKITFGFDGKQTPEPPRNYIAKGQFKLVDHGSGDRIHGIIEEILVGGLAFKGSCSINGQGDYTFYVRFSDRGKPGAEPGDEIYVAIWESSMRFYEGELKGGNIKIHKK